MWEAGSPSTVATVNFMNQYSVPTPGTGLSWTPIDLGSLDLVERHPIANPRPAKKCTCGTQSGPDGGICSDYCDLVRIDD